MSDEFKKSNLSILFIDDEEKSAKYFQKTFGKYFNIITTTNPHEALDIIESKSDEIAIVISDQIMPNSSGVELLAQIKDKHYNIIRILTTAYSSLENNIAAINKSNIYAYLTKPWNLEETRDILFRALDEFQSRRNYLSLSGSIAHEMRNPLNNVRQSTKFAKEKLSNANRNEVCCDILNGEKITPLTKGDFEDIITSLDIADNSAKRGNAIIDIILNNINGKPTDTSHFRHVSISGIIDTVMTEYSFKEHEKNKVHIDVKPEQNFIFKGDEISLTYVFFNLLKNSLYYIQSHKNLSVNIRSEIGKDGFNRIYFRDSGPGIPQEKFENLFEAFSTCGKREGTGLGLAFCKRTLKTLGGDINCASKEGEFTEFTLSFPKVDKARIEDDLGSSNSRILLVDDQETNLMVAKRLLEKNLLSTSCDTAKNGLEALEKVRKINYDIILMDIEMPEMNGIDATKEIRKFDRKIPIIAHSSKTLESVIEDLKISGFNGYVSKPSNEITLKMVSKWGIIKLKNPLLEKSTMQDFLRNKNILLADDEDINLALTEKYLSKYEASVDKARDGLEAYEMAQNKNYDLILIDVQMPRLDGISAVKKIRKYQIDNNLNLVPAIALTGDNADSQIYKILNAGFDDYFIKGANYDDLADIVAFWINMKNSKDVSVALTLPE